MIEVSRLTKVYRTRVQRSHGFRHLVRSLIAPETALVTALDAVDFEVTAGSLHALIGRNGSGKSTLLKLLCGILHPSSGSATVGGVVPWLDRERYVRGIGVVFGQKSQLTWELPALASFELHQRLFGISQPAYQHRLRRLLRLCDAARIVERPVRSLSLGERMKCELICALLHEPKVLFLDEPTIGLDLVAKDQVRSAIAELHAELNTTVVLASHDISDVASSCPSVSVLDRGRFLYRGTVAALLSTHARQHRVRLELARPVSALVEALAGHRFVQNGERHVTVELGVGAERLPEALSRLFAELPVIDVQIEGPSLEGVVRSLYARAAKSAAPASEACSGREGALVEAE